MNNATPADAAKRLHDFRAAYRTLSMAISSIADGYRFDDPNASAKIKALQTALTTIENELHRVEAESQAETNKRP